MPTQTARLIHATLSIVCQVGPDPFSEEIYFQPHLAYVAKHKCRWGFYATFMPEIGMYQPFSSLACLPCGTGNALAETRRGSRGGDCRYINNVTANTHITTAMTPSNICQARGRANIGIKNRAPNPRLENQMIEAAIAPSAK